MGFKSGGYAKVWGTTVYEKYTTVEMSTSKKNKQTGNFDTDWSSKFVRFIGQAHKDAVSLKRGDKIKIGDCEVTNKYDKAKGIAYTDYLVYSFTIENSAPTIDNPSNSAFMVIPDDAIDDLPFS